jgi:Alpha/beta hydrolase domain
VTEVKGPAAKASGLSLLISTAQGWTLRETLTVPVWRRACPWSASTRLRPATAALAGAVATAGPHIVPLPSVQYLPRTATSYPFDAADKETTPIELAAYGYAEKEYLISGTSNVYQWTGTRLGVDVENANVPCTTRILVRAPPDPRRFSGRVFVEIVNASNNWDYDVMWGAMCAKLMADGDAWVGVTDDPGTFAALKIFDASRYGTLSMPNPNQSATCASPNERGLGWDVLAQVGRLLRNSGPADPLAAYHVHDIDAAGYSPSASMLVTYINAVAPISELPYGGPVFNGYLVGSGAFNASGLNPINDCAPTVPETDRRHIVQPPGVPVIATRPSRTTTPSAATSRGARTGRCTGSMRSPGHRTCGTSRSCTQRAGRSWSKPAFPP